uniref:Uncharacterized protein n=1 Tax=Caenorhabditis japonica TaxID=281687 RepID=A0A8R1E472_CAEJA
MWSSKSRRRWKRWVVRSTAVESFRVAWSSTIFLCENVDLGDEVVLGAVHLPECFVHVVVQFSDVEQGVSLLLKFALVPLDSSELVDRVEETTLVVAKTQIVAFVQSLFVFVDEPGKQKIRFVEPSPCASLTHPRTLVCLSPCVSTCSPLASTRAPHRISSRLAPLRRSLHARLALASPRSIDSIVLIYADPLIIVFITPSHPVFLRPTIKGENPFISTGFRKIDIRMSFDSPF